MGLIEFIVIILALILIGKIQNRKVTTSSQYLLANRSTSLFALVATLVMTEFNTGTLLSFSGVGFLAQNWALTMALIFLIGLVFYALTVAKQWKKFNGVSIAHYFTQRYGKDIGYFVAVILFLAMIGFTAAYVKSLTLLFEPLMPTLSHWTIGAIMTLLILLMTLRGGLVSIIRTDIFSFCLVVLFFPLLAYFAYHLPVASQHHLTFQQMQAALPARFIISLIILTMFSYILAPWYGQKIVAAKSQSIAFLAVLIAACLIALLYTIGIWSASLLSREGVVLSNSEMAIPYLINHVIPSYLQGFSYALLFCIAATTLSGVWNAMVTLLLGEAKHCHGVSKGIYLNFLCALLSYIISNCLTTSILNSMILANIPIVALSFALLAGFFWSKTTRAGVYASIIVGNAWGVFCAAYYGQAGLYAWYWALIGIPLIFCVGALVSIFTQKSTFTSARSKSLMTP